MGVLKKVLLLTVALVLALAAVVPAQAADFFGVADFQRYTEPDGDFHWADNELRLVVAAELFSGYPPEKPETLYYFKETGGVVCKVLGELRPDRTITRGEYATIVARALDMGARAYGSSPFSDVKPSDWFGPNVLRLVAAGIIDPADYGDKLNPNGPITREEIAVWMVRAAEAAGVRVEPASVSFRDFDPNSKHAPYVAKAVGAGFLKGYPDGSFRPERTANRAEAAVMLVRLLKKMPLFEGLDAEKAKQMVVEATNVLADAQEKWYPKRTVGWERNPEFETALKWYQENAKDLVTEYNLWPRMHPGGIEAIYDLAGRDEVGPRCDWAGIEAGYGLVDGALLRNGTEDYDPGERWGGILSLFRIITVGKKIVMEPTVHTEDVPAPPEVLAFCGAGPVAEVQLKAHWKIEYVAEGHCLGDWFYDFSKEEKWDKCVNDGIRALFVKQGGKWKIAALYKDARGPWLKLIGFAR